MKTATILGAGVMGSSMCMPFVEVGMGVRLVGTHLDTHIIDGIRSSGMHPKLKVTMPAGVKTYHHADFDAALGTDTDLILLGVASAGVAWAIDKLANAMTAPMPVLMITKGMQPMEDGLGALPDVVAHALKERLGFDVPVAAVGGPCIAGELAARRHTGTVVVSHDGRLARQLAERLACDFYFPRFSTDMMGVELCAAFKNFYAITVGWAHGRNELLDPAENAARNNNAASILFDQAVREMLVLSMALGGRPESVWGMPGVGDLYVTCQAGRNSRLGHALGRGLTYDEAKAGPLKDETVEGAELGIAVSASLRNMVASGRIAAGEIPLALALLDTLTEGKRFEPPWQQLHQAG